jgi:Na+-transporting methylmalonyl-CoA/oxaloacetate decarboxylase gamma subunit
MLGDYMIDLTANPFLVGLQIAATGMSIVFIVLTIVVGALSILNRSQGLFQAKPASATKPAVPQGSTSSTTTDQLDPQLIAILTAAAVTALDQPVRILRVRYYRQLAVNWARLGRVSVMAARQLRR